MTGSFDVTHRELQLGTRDSVTGWYEKHYVESTIEMVFEKRGATVMNLSGGGYVRVDEIGRTADVVEEWDEIYRPNGRYYEVHAVEPVYGPADNFMWRECGLVYLPLHDRTYTSLTPSVEDARYRTKVYWDTYISLSNLNSHPFIVCYSDPNYPIVKVYQTKGIDIIFAVSQPNSTPMLQHDQTPYGYEEHVPTHVLTLDTQLQWLAEAELRRIVEAYPQGSHRSLERRSARNIQLGSTALYDTEFILNYKRDTT